MNLDGIKLTKNEDASRFEMNVEDHIAFVIYTILSPSEIELFHTEVPVALEGKGVAGVLAKNVLEYCKENNFHVKATCPYISHYIVRHPEWESLCEARKVNF
jgi:predicted GNAT family acetyltransferase